MRKDKVDFFSNLQERRFDFHHRMSSAPVLVHRLNCSRRSQGDLTPSSVGLCPRPWVPPTTMVRGCCCPFPRTSRKEQCRRSYFCRAPVEMLTFRPSNWPIVRAAHTRRAHWGVAADGAACRPIRRQGLACRGLVGRRRRVPGRGWPEFAAAGWFLASGTTGW